jgi:hypothetical protein
MLRSGQCLSSVENWPAGIRRLIDFQSRYCL